MNTCSTCRHWHGGDGAYQAECGAGYGRPAFSDTCKAWGAKGVAPSDVMDELRRWAAAERRDFVIPPASDAFFDVHAQVYRLPDGQLISLEELMNRASQIAKEQPQ